MPCFLLNLLEQNPKILPTMQQTSIKQKLKVLAALGISTGMLLIAQPAFSIGKPFKKFTVLKEKHLHRLITIQ
jgi:hypothetical protein